MFCFSRPLSVTCLPPASQALSPIAVRGIFAPGQSTRVDEENRMRELTPHRLWHAQPRVTTSLAGEAPRWQHSIKRFWDVVVASFLCLALFPLFLLIALAIRIESPGPVFFRQLRRGKGGRRFLIVKFRSMRVDADEERRDHRELNEQEEPLFKMRVDPRTTSVGRMLRRSSLDELPQLLNVLQGEMSLVGPRPLPIDDVERCLHASKSSDWIEERETVKPGLTGLWQVLGRCEYDHSGMPDQDRYYVRNWSLLLDLQILLRTIPVVVLGKGSY
jgi:lipopolysaccharide/colanic/teichoic acid biosynthesis glycosyltransferase